MKTAILRTRKRLKINIVFITLNDVEQNAKKILDLRDVPPMCLLFVFFDARRLCQQLNSWFVLYAGQHGKANMSFHIVVVKSLVLTHSPGPFVVYIVINLLAVLLLRVIKLASRKNRKDYGVLLTSIREW